MGVLLFLPLICDFKLCLAFLGFIISQIYFHDSHMKQLTCQNIDATVNRDLNWKICECVSHFCLLFFGILNLRCTYMALILNCGLHFWPWRMRFPEEGEPGSPASVHPVIIQ